MKCKDLAQKYGVTAMQVGRRRKQFFPDGDGDLTEEEVDVLTEYYESLEDIDTRKEIEEAIQPQFVEGMVCYVPKSTATSHVQCRVRGEDGKIITVPALMPRLERKPIVGTRLKLEVIELDTGVKRYRHASLTNISWPQEMLK